MNWKKGGLWVIIFFVVKGTISTLLIVTGAKYFGFIIHAIVRIDTNLISDFSNKSKVAV